MSAADSANAGLRGYVLIPAVMHRAARRVVPLGARLVGARHDSRMGCKHPCHQLDFRTPSESLLLADDGCEHHLHLPQHASEPEQQPDAGNEVDDVPDAGDVPRVLQRLWSRFELLLLHLSAHHNRSDIRFPIHHQGRQGARQDG